MKKITGFIASSVLLLFSSCTPSSKDASPAASTDSLRSSLAGIIAPFKATVGVSVLELESGDTLTVNGQSPFPMLSVYKFPLALCILKKADKGEISLQQRVLINPEMLHRFARNKMKVQNPDSSFTLSVDSLLMYMISYSDNLSCDLLFKLAGGTQVADSFIREAGFPPINMKYTEEEMAKNPGFMYRNSSTPYEMTRLLKAFYDGKMVSDASTKRLLYFMTNDSTTHKRLYGQLPPGTIIAHKTGTGIASDSLVNACNDVGIIYLPNGKHLAVSAFVMNAHESKEDAEKLIATIAKVIYLHYAYLDQ